MFLKPAPGRKVRMPNENALLPEKGADVEYCEYWARRVNCGDAIIEPAKPAETQPTVKKALKND